MMLLDDMALQYGFRHDRKLARPCPRDVRRDGSRRPGRLIEALKARGAFRIRQRLRRGLQSQMRQLRRSRRFLVTVGRVEALTANEGEHAAEQGLVGYEARADDADGLLDCAPD